MTDERGRPAPGLKFQFHLDAFASCIAAYFKSCVNTRPKKARVENDQ